MKFWLVDTFTAQPFSGNPTSVFMLDSVCEKEVLEKVAVEMGTPETVFISSFEGSASKEHASLEPRIVYELRRFSPFNEMACCSHGVLAAAHVLMQEFFDRAACQAFFFETPSGVYKATYDNGYVALDLPCVPVERVSMPEDLLDGLSGILPVYVGCSCDTYLVELRHPKHVFNLIPDFSAILALGGKGVIVTSNYDSESLDPINEEAFTREGFSYDYVARFFEPALGISEDFVNAYAHSLLAPYWERRTNKSSFRAKHASVRGGDALVEVKNERVFVKGQAIIMGRGDLFI